MKPKRNGLRDNLLGLIACIIVAGILFAQPSVQAACQATRIGGEQYMLTCIWPALTAWALVVAAIVLPIVGLTIARFKTDAALGVVVISLCCGLFFAVVWLAVLPEAVPFALLAGLTAGLIFTLVRDHAASITNHPPQ
ncbi:MAG: hypothetical protein AAFR27_00365 [Pseudomonadota bacterium]